MDGSSHRQRTRDATRPWTHDRVLVGPESGQEHVVCELSAQTFGDLAQDVVAGRIAKRLVDLLEPIEAHKQDGRSTLVRAVAEDVRCGLLDELDAAGQARQLVDMRKVLDHFRLENSPR